MRINLKSFIAALMSVLIVFVIYTTYHSTYTTTVNRFGKPTVDTTGAVFNNNGTWTLKDGSIWDGQ